MKIITALDIGTTKVCCLIARIENDGSLSALGAGIYVNHGVKGGQIVDMEKTAQAISAAVNIAENMAGDRISTKVIVNLNGISPVRHMVSNKMPIARDVVTQKDVTHLLYETRNSYKMENNQLVHAMPQYYKVDNSPALENPLNMNGQELSLKMHLLFVPPSIMQNIISVVQKGHLQVQEMVFTPYASALAVLIEQERKLGSILLDMGAGTTGICAFMNGAPVFCDTVLLGGAHITNDIARGLSTPIDEAEKLKTRYGHLIPTASDDKEFIDIIPIGENITSVDYRRKPKSELIRIIAPRMEEILEEIAKKLENAGIHTASMQNIVLTGGASNMPGLDEAITQYFDRPVRFARPKEIKSLVNAATGPDFASVVGMLYFAIDNAGDARSVSVSKSSVEGGAIRRSINWIKGNL